MNLYDLHANPKSLYGYDRTDMEVPAVFWDRYYNKPEELKKREAVIAKDAQYAYLYALMVLKSPFPVGEAAIAKDEEYAYKYANYVLEGPFPAGAAAIAKNPMCAYLYAHDVLKGPFPAGEAAIAKNPMYADRYKQFLKGLKT